MNRLEKIQVEEEKIRYADKFAFIVLRVFMNSVVVTLYKEHGFGAKRLSKFCKDILKEANLMGSGMIGIDDYEQYAKELTKFTIPDEIYEEI